ncbi:MAG: thioredoxin family protein, partial [Thermodesulfobacteriota bacterium]
MTPRDESRIREWSDRLPGEVTLRLVLSRSDEAKNHELTGFCDALTRIAPAIHLKKEKAEADDPAPALEIAPTLRYQAVPLGLELPPFLDALAGTSMGTSDSLQADLEKIPAPVYFKLYVAQTCPHCPLVVRQLAPLALAGDTLHLTVIDGGLFTETAEADGIQAVPTLILDDDRRWTGSLKPEEIL